MRYATKLLPVLATFLAVGESCSKHSLPGGRYVDLIAVDTIVQAGSHLLAAPTELTLDRQGRLFVTDFDANAIVVLDSSGTALRTIGRTGSGPGEFLGPRATRVWMDTLRVLDGGNARVAVFTTDGRFVRAETMPLGAQGGAISLGPQGQAVLALNGRHGALAQRFEAGGVAGHRFGSLVVEAPEVWNFTAIKQEIFDGRVPAQLRNMTRPLRGADGTAWLILEAEARLEQYSPTDSLQWDQTLNEPEFPSIRADFFAANRQDSAGFRFRPLSFVAGGQEVAHQLWLLLRQPDSAAATFLVIDRKGAITNRVRVLGAHGIRAFAVDPAKRWLYLLNSDEVAVLRVPIPPDVLGAT